MKTLATSAPAAEHGGKAPVNPFAKAAKEHRDIHLGHIERGASRSDMESDAPRSEAGAPDLSHDFGRVRVHPDGRPAEPSHGGQLRSKGECAAAVPAGFGASLASDRSQPLPGALRLKAEQDFDHPFHQVRLHTGPDAHRMTGEVSARAFTLGNDIAFRAGQYAPETKEGMRLLWHELGHVVAPAKEPRVLRDPLPQNGPGQAVQGTQAPPLKYGTEIVPTPAPPVKGVSAETIRKAIKKERIDHGDMTDAIASGVTKNSDEEIFLLNFIYHLDMKDRKGTFYHLNTAIGWKDPSTNVIPQGLVTLTIDEKAVVTIELVRTGPRVSTPQLTVAAATAQLQADFGVVVVNNKDKAWTPEELSEVSAAFALVPKADWTALKGVELRRVTSVNSEATGEFATRQGVDDKANPPTVVYENVLRLGDNAFNVQMIGGKRVPQGENVVGDTDTGKPVSYRTILHEVGHAVEKQRKRETAKERDEAWVVENKAATARDATYTTYEGLKDKSSPEAGKLNKEYSEEVKKAHEAHVTFNQKDSDAKATMIGAADLKAITDDADGKKKDLDKATQAADTAAAAFSPKDLKDSDVYRASVAAARKAIDDYATNSSGKDANVLMNLEKALVNEVAKRKKACSDLRKAIPSNPALTAFHPVDIAQDAWVVALRTAARAPERTQRLQKFVTVVNNAKITPFTQYARETWPYDPAEFYAEAYSMWLTEPNFLNTNYKDIYHFFQSGDYRN